MKTRKIRCYRAFAEANGVYNNEVCFVAPDGYRLVLATCTKCGEIYAIDFENPKTAGLNVRQIAAGKTCVRCGSDLAETASEYPQTFVARDGRLGCFEPPRIIPPDSESEVREVPELVPVR